MVFSSVPPYLDPSNWHQQPNHHQPGTTTENPQLQEPPPQPSVGGASMGSIRPGSMADRARMAKLPQPESALKCPRCESTNTKFCYFNNYSLSQPRHFCKTCRRYWTRGGALRNVPVGGGCRRNKRSKGSRSKSPVTAERQKVLGTTNANSISANNPSNTFTTHDILAHHHHMQPHHQLPQLPFMTSLHHLTDHYGGGDHIGLNYSGVQPHIGGTGGGVAPEMDFQIGSNSGSSGAILSSASGGSDQQWRLQQFPFLGGLDHTQGGLYPIDQGDQGVEAPVGFSHQLRSTTKSTASLISQLASVKMEDNPSSGLNLSRQLLGIPIGGSSTADHQYWGGNAWATDLSSFSSSSTSPLL